jgi:Fe-S oxidoreductase
MDLDIDKAKEEIMKISEGEDSFVLQDCVTCYGCEEYCKRGNHPFYLITERRQQKGILTSPRAITKQWINIGEPRGKYRLGEIKEKILSFGFMPEFLQLVKGRLFDDVMPSYVFGQEFFCNVVYIHFANTSIIKERLPMVIDNFKKLGVQEVVCVHDECYGSFASLAPAYGIEVPFKSIHYFEYLYNRLEGLGGGGIFSMAFGYELANDVQKRNVDDMVDSGAEYCVFNCPACQSALAAKVTKKGIKPIHIIDLCRMAIGEK